MLSRERRTYEQWSGRIYRHRRRRKIGKRHRIGFVNILHIYVVSRKSPTYVCKFQILQEAQGFLTFHRPPTHKSIRGNEGVSSGE